METVEPPHTLSAHEVADRLDTDPARGLTPQEAERRLHETGPNRLPDPPRESDLVRFLRQFREPMALLLIVAAGVSGLALGERIDAVAIMAIVLLNAVIGAVQEGRAARALEALRSMEAPLSRLVREGRVREIEAAHVVPGDIVLLAAGDRVPADIRLLEGTSLEVDESLLTGESLPVGKDPAHRSGEDDPLGDRLGMAFSGTLVTRGSGRGVVVATGSATSLGRIAGELEDEPKTTPLQEELVRLTTRLGLIAVAVAIFVMLLVVVRSGTSFESWERAFLSAVALAVAAVPEGLPTVVTVALALGVRRMAARGAIIRRLPAVETLGSTTALLTDKTGTLTENELELESLVLIDGDPVQPGELPEAVHHRIARTAVLCNDATLDPPSGDPVDLALLRSFRDDVRSDHARIAEIPFDSERKRMTTVNRAGADVVLFVKGAPESVLERCTTSLTSDGEVVPLGDEARAALAATADEMAAAGMRLLALACRRLDEEPADVSAAEGDLTFLALAALRDPIRSTAAGAVREAGGAGIRLVMVTGDHLGTALSVAKEVGMVDGAERAVAGAELRRQGIPESPASVPVYARVDPEQKLQLVEALQQEGHVVAVTGDGVNDAPALRRADIGVAMGASGSDVAREAADMVVTDDDLATIVAAVHEGRGIYDNVRKVVDYLVAGNLSEILVVVAGLLFFPALGVPLTPVQLLWINLLTDGLPALALGLDPADPGLMRRPPRPPGDRLLSRTRIAGLSARGVLMAAAAVAVLVIARYGWDEPWEVARTAMFTTLVVTHLVYAFVARHPTRGLLSNPRLLGAVGLGLALQALVVVVPALRQVFDTAALAAGDWITIMAVGAVPTLLMVAFRRLGWAYP